MCNLFAFHHQVGIDTWRSNFEQQTDSILSACGSRHKDPKVIDLSVPRRAQYLHNTRYLGSTSILRFGRDWKSIRLDRMQSSFKKHFQLIVFQIHVTSTSAKGLIETRMEKRIGFRSCSTTRGTSWSTI